MLAKYKRHKVSSECVNITVYKKTILRKLWWSTSKYSTHLET